MNHSVINSIMKPHRTRGESKYMLEEIYFSDLCGSIKKKDKVRGKTVPGGQNCPVFDKVSAGADLEGASGSWTGKVTKAFQATPSVRYFQ